MIMSDIQKLALEGLATTDNEKMLELFLKAVSMCRELELKNQALQDSLAMYTDINKANHGTSI